MSPRLFWLMGLGDGADAVRKWLSAALIEGLCGSLLRALLRAIGWGWQWVG